MLTSTALQPVYGRLSDIWGRKVVLLGSLFVFLVGSLACSLSQSMIQLIVFRAIQGLGGGGILTLAMIIISDVVSLKDRGKYQGITGGVVATANSLGPILGGVFTEKLNWRWCFVSVVNVAHVEEWESGCGWLGWWTRVVATSGRVQRSTSLPPVSTIR
jgi:MFS family permease